MEITPQDQSKVVALITALFPTAKIYLYGSRARGDHTRSSDIDLALDAGSIIDFVALGEVKDILNATDLPYKFDLVDFHSISSAMRDQIVKERVVWKS